MIKKNEVYNKILRVKEVFILNLMNRMSDLYYLNHFTCYLKKLQNVNQEIKNLFSKWDDMKEAEGWKIEYTCIQYDIIISEVTKALEQFRKRHTSS